MSADDLRPYIANYIWHRAHEFDDPDYQKELTDKAIHILSVILPYHGIPVTVVYPDDNPLHIREWTTANLERELEVLRWHRADAEATWGPDSENALVTRYLVEPDEQAITKELERRRLAATMPSAPRWPDRQEDRRDLFDEIKDRSNIVDVAIDRLGLRSTSKQAGVFWFQCFAHEDKTPSLAVYPSDQHFHCYACHAHGDVIDLVKGALHLSSLQQALHYLGEWTGATKRTIVVQRGDETVEVEAP
jgi:hypothetical protein